MGKEGKTDKLGNIDIKNFGTSKDTVKRAKANCRMGAGIFNPVSAQGLIFRNYKGLLQLKDKNTIHAKRGT